MNCHFSICRISNALFVKRLFLNCLFVKCLYQISFDGDSQRQISGSRLSHQSDRIDEGDDVGINSPIIILEEVGPGVAEDGEAEHEDGGDDQEGVATDESDE